MNIKINIIFIIFYFLIGCSSEFKIPERENVITVCTFNLKFFGDTDKKNDSDYGSFGRNIRVGNKNLMSKFAQYINKADIIAVQEVENTDAFNNLIVFLNSEYPERKYKGFFRDRKQSPQDIGLIWDTNKVKGSRGYFFSGKWNVVGDRADGRPERFSRPPVFNFFEVNGIKFIVVNVHLKAKAGEDDSGGGRRENEAAKILEWIENQQTEKNIENIIVLGDFNDRHSFNLETTDLDPLLIAEKENKLIFLTKNFKPPKYYTVFGEFAGEKYKETIDHIVITTSLEKYYLKNSCNIIIHNDDSISDHHPVFATFEFN